MIILLAELALLIMLITHPIALDYWMLFDLVFDYDHLQEFVAL